MKTLILAVAGLCRSELSFAVGVPVAVTVEEGGIAAGTGVVRVYSQPVSIG